MNEIERVTKASMVGWKNRYKKDSIILARRFFLRCPGCSDCLMRSRLRTNGPKSFDGISRLQKKPDYVIGVKARHQFHPKVNRDP